MPINTLTADCVHFTQISIALEQQNCLGITSYSPESSDATDLDVVPFSIVEQALAQQTESGIKQCV